MNRILILLLALILFSCEKNYREISEADMKSLTIQETLINKPDLKVFKVGDSASDAYPQLLLKSGRIYLFESNCELKNDSVVLAYHPAFIIDSSGEFRKNGLWIYSDFYTEGKFPFTKKGIKFSPDSIPPNWNQKVPTKEGIYFYENNALVRLSSEQSEEKFKEKEKDGFYFIPNSGRLFDKININDLE